jgi:hypothetical protein
MSLEQDVPAARRAVDALEHPHTPVTSHRWHDEGIGAPGRTAR